MTPTSPLAGLLTGLMDGGIVVILVLLVSYLYGRKTNGEPVKARPVAEDHAPRLAKAPTGELPTLHHTAA